MTCTLDIDLKSIIVRKGVLETTMLFICSEREEGQGLLISPSYQWRSDNFELVEHVSFIQLSSDDGDTSTPLPLNNKQYNHPLDYPKAPAKNDVNKSRPSIDTVVQEYEAYIDAGELVILDGNMTDIHKQDTLASALFAQSAADYKFSRTAKPEEWDKNYGEVLGQIGWVLVKNSFEEAKVDNVFVVSEVVLKTFKEKFSKLDEEVFCYLREFLNNLEVLTTNNQPVEIFYNKSYGNGSINFAVSFYGGMEDDNSIMLFSNRVYFDVCEMSKPFLFHLFEPECVGGKVHVEISQYKLSEGTYSKVRKTILEKLGNRMKTYVSKMKPF